LDQIIESYFLEIFRDRKLSPSTMSPTSYFQNGQQSHNWLRLVLAPACHANVSSKYPGGKTTATAVQGAFFQGA
jgi:hypothetical protein